MSPTTAPLPLAPTHDVIVVGGGSAGLAAAASLLRRRPGLSVAVVEPKDLHDYQPGWTLVGAGVFSRAATQRPLRGLMPRGATWIRASVSRFEPERDGVLLDDGQRLTYRVLVAAPGLRLDWRAVEGLPQTLGRNGVTSNYLAELAPYTWELVQSLKHGRALFTQPPMPIKCAGAPQKAAYLSCDHWRRHGRLNAINAEFHTAAPVLFGVPHYVPALMAYVQRYGVDLNLKSRLIAVDGDRRQATFEVTDAEESVRRITRPFDMLHVCPPQTAPEVVASSPLADQAGWIDVDPDTLRHVRYPNIFGLGDAIGASNAKTAAAARKQAPIVAENALAVLDGQEPRCIYDGYGSCPLTVERGKIVLAEFGYGGKLLPTFPRALLDGDRPTARAWLLKEGVLPFIYWNGMLKGREWLVRPRPLPLARR